MSVLIEQVYCTQERIIIFNEGCLYVYAIRPNLLIYIAIEFFFIRALEIIARSDYGMGTSILVQSKITQASFGHAMQQISYIILYWLYHATCIRMDEYGLVIVWWHLLGKEKFLWNQPQWYLGVILASLPAWPLQ